ncbi:dTDP-glucose 4,6-dehydratase [Thermoproteota archaeon]
MRKKLHKILVSGGAGFIGSEFVRQASSRCYKIIVIDCLTYAGDRKRLSALRGRFDFYNVDICDKEKIKRIIKRERPNAIVHFAAESHVDRSIVDSFSFLKTNVLGTQQLLDIARTTRIEKFIHISTDEVYGEIHKGAFSENSSIRPNNPYSASKAAGDILTSAYVRTHKLPAIIIRPCNNYGPWQYPEKLIPLTILRSLCNKKIPVYGKGLQKREWLFVSDCASGILRIMEKGKLGEIYNLGSGQERRNIDVVKLILKTMHKPFKLIQFVKDRLGHDYRYFSNSEKVIKLGWKPRINFEEGIRETLSWCFRYQNWLKSKKLA